VRVVIAPDKFAGTLSAVEAARAVAEGWRGVDPGADLDLCPLSDGGPAFVDVLAEARPGRMLTVTVTGPLGEPVEGRVLRVGDIAYVESAQACGLDLVPPERREPARATTYGVGELIAAAVADGGRHIVIGLGGSATTDCGAGMLAALGATATRKATGVPAGTGPDGTDLLALGGGALPEIGSVDLAAARRAVDGVELVAASDVDSPLCGLYGAAAIFAPQKGADRAQVLALDAALEGFAGLVAPDLAERPGAGAAGGLGFAVFALGGGFGSGIGSVLEAVRLDARTATADLVITGEGSFDHQSLRGKVAYGVAQVAAAHGVPCAVLAGRVAVGRREMAAANITEAYALVDPPGSEAAAFAEPHAELARVAARVARLWTRSR
jgi:glycerate kinase